MRVLNRLVILVLLVFAAFPARSAARGMPSLPTQTFNSIFGSLTNRLFVAKLGFTSTRRTVDGLPSTVALFASSSLALLRSSRSIDAASTESMMSNTVRATIAVRDGVGAFGSFFFAAASLADAASVLGEMWMMNPPGPDSISNAPSPARLASSCAAALT